MRIEHIDDVLPSVIGRDDFVVAQRDGYQVVDYNFALPDSFDDPVRVECRGIKFATDGRIIARPFHKFFNIGERPNTQAGVIDFSQPHTITEKLDGSMIHPAIVGGKILLMTRMGWTDVARKAERHLYDKLAGRMARMLGGGMTPIFEFTAPDNRIVIQYANSGLSLLAVRATVSGEYMGEVDLQIAADDLGVPLVRHFGPNWSDGASFQAFARAVIGSEGFVVRFQNGLWVKAKGDDYVLKHKAKESVLQEKNVLAMILGEQLDDVLPLLDAADRDAITAYRDDVLSGVRATAEQVEAIVMRGRDFDQKTFAVNHLANVDGHLKPLAFSVRSGALAEQAVRGFLLKNASSQSRVDASRFLHGARWPEFLSGSILDA